MIREQDRKSKEREEAHREQLNDPRVQRGIEAVNRARIED